MKILRMYYRWNIDIMDGLRAALTRWPILAVAGGSAVLVILQVTDAPLWLKVVEGALVGGVIYHLYAEA